jgi:flotillin
MQDRSGLGEQFTAEVDSNLKEWGVATVKMIEFMDIRDSNNSGVIADMMAKEKSRIEMESRVTVANNIREAEMKEIEANREVALSKTQADQVVGIRQAEADQKVGIAKEKAAQEVQTEAKITTERVMEVKKVEDVKSAEIAKEVAVVKAQQDKEVQVVNADAEKEATVRIATGKLDATKKDAEGIQAVGAAKAEAEKQMLLAPVNAQITLANEIGSNEGYQAYLIEVRKVEATEVVGKEMAAAMSKADLKVIANSGSVQNGVASLGDIFTPAGGTSIAGMLEALAQTDQGKALVAGVTSKLSGAPAEAETAPVRKRTRSAPAAEQQ